MNCEMISKLIPLYYYGELTPEEEERLEAHTHECPVCTRQLEQQRALASALEAVRGGNQLRAGNRIGTEAEFGSNLRNLIRRKNRELVQ